jgi:hypothetical protein
VERFRLGPAKYDPATDSGMSIRVRSVWLSDGFMSRRHAEMRASEENVIAILVRALEALCIQGGLGLIAGGVVPCHPW